MNIFISLIIYRLVKYTEDKMVAAAKVNDAGREHSYRPALDMDLGLFGVPKSYTITSGFQQALEPRTAGARLLNHPLFPSHSHGIPTVQRTGGRGTLRAISNIPPGLSPKREIFN